MVTCSNRIDRDMGVDRDSGEEVKGDRSIEIRIAERTRQDNKVG